MKDEIIIEAEQIREDYTDEDGAALWKYYKRLRKHRRVDPGDGPAEED